MKYFAKYLQIDDNTPLKESEYWQHPKGAVFPYTETYKKAFESLGDLAKKVKLFLCSRDIQVGDSIIDEKNQTYTVDNGNINFIGKTIKGYKVIGEISKHAIWVKNGDKFTEEQVGFYIALPWDIEEECELQDYLRSTIYKEIRIQCPTCLNFH